MLFCCFCKTPTLNRTILELKHSKSHDSRRINNHFKSYHFGIETDVILEGARWEVVFKSYHFGIETTVSDGDINGIPVSLNRTILELKLVLVNLG